MYEEIFLGKVDLFEPSLGDKKTIIPWSFDFDLKKKKKEDPLTCTYSKKVVEDNQTNILGGPKVTAKNTAKKTKTKQNQKKKTNKQNKTKNTQEQNMYFIWFWRE